MSVITITSPAHVELLPNTCPRCPECGDEMYAWDYFKKNRNYKRVYVLSAILCSNKECKNHHEYVCFDGHEELVKFLLNRGGSPTTETK